MRDGILVSACAWFGTLAMDVWVKERNSGMKIKTILQLMRPVPLMIWSVPTVLLGFVLQPTRQSHWAIELGIAIMGALILQGLVTHGLNDMFDWDSGTDRNTTGIISGGSRVLPDGLMTRVQMLRIVIAAAMAYLGLTAVFSIYRGPGVWLWAMLGLYGSIAYSVPPLRLSYRPYWGEWLALLPTMVSGVMLGGYAASALVSPRLLWGAAIYGAFCVASVMQHHLSDMEADWLANPQKRTTPTYWQNALHQSPLGIILLYETLAVILAFIASLTVWTGFLVTVLAILASMVVTRTTPLPSSPKTLTIRDLAIKLLSFSNVVALMILGLWH